MEIIHQPEHLRFVSVIDNEEAWLEYELMPRHGINFTSTFVPEAMRGSGVAQKLVRAGLAWAREQGFTIEATCWYVQRFLR